MQAVHSEGAGSVTCRSLAPLECGSTKRTRGYFPTILTREQYAYLRCKIIGVRRDPLQGGGEGASQLPSPRCLLCQCMGLQRTRDSTSLASFILSCSRLIPREHASDVSQRMISLDGLRSEAAHDKRPRQYRATGPSPQEFDVTAFA